MVTLMSGSVQPPSALVGSRYARGTVEVSGQGLLVVWSRYAPATEVRS